VNKVILDASALLALVKNEPGTDKVEKLLGSIIMSCVNVSEVATVLFKVDMSLEDFKESILPLVSTILPFDEEQALMTASLQKKTKSKGLSLGDRACLALGITKQLPIYTDDRIWTELDLENVDIRLIR
jgi:ribonuclease VapC